MRADVISRTILVAVLLTLLALSAPERARACSILPCTTRLAPLGNGTHPAHLPVNGVFVGAPPAMAGSRVSVVIERDGVEEMRSIEPALVVEIPDVEEGDRVRVTMEPECGGSLSTVIDVTAFAPIPTSIGTLEVASSRRTVIEVRDDRGSCTSDFAVSVAPFSLVIDPSVEPWRDALVETVLVDDSVWRESYDAAVESRFVYAACEEPASTQRPTPLSLGSHRLRIEARIRGVARARGTNEEAFVLGCEIPPGTDAAVMSDGSITPAASASCSAARAHRSWFNGFAILGVVATILARRRRRARSSTRCAALVAMALGGCESRADGPDASELDATTSVSDAGVDAPSRCVERCTGCLWMCGPLCATSRGDCIAEATSCDEARVCVEGPTPTVRAWLEPADLTTDVAPRLLSVRVQLPLRSDSDGVFSTLGAALSLEDAAGARVEATVALPDVDVDADGSADIVLTPTRPLEAGWYVLRVDDLPSLYQLTPTQRVAPRGEGASAAVRVHVGSEPRVAHVQLCERTPAQWTILAALSERVDADDAIAGMELVRADGAPCFAEVPEVDEDHGASTMRWQCDALTESETLELVISSEIRGLAGGAMIAETIDLARDHAEPLTERCVLLRGGADLTLPAYTPL